eukprot:130272_1
MHRVVTMFEQHSVFKYLKHQARCIEAQLGEEDKHCFFVGTYTPQPENELHLIEFIEETNEIITRNIFNHPNEIYSISACPTNPSLLFTTHRGGFMNDILSQAPKPDTKNNDDDTTKDTDTDKDKKSEQDDTKDNTQQAPDTDEKSAQPTAKAAPDNPYLYKATLWRLMSEDSTDNLVNDLNDALNEDGDSYNINSLNSENLRLQPIFTLPNKTVIAENAKDKQISTHTVLWDGLGVGSHLMSLGDNCIQFWKFGDKYSCIVEDKCIYDSERLNRLTCGCWDPHYPNRFISTNDKTIRVWEAKSLKEIQTIENAHKSCILSVDHNPNKPYHIVTSSEDRTIKFWDLRNSKQPLKILSNHSHWIWCVKYNRYHDQLIISSGSDSNVSLWNIVSVSSAPLGELEENSKGEDRLIKTYKEHEESVYWSSWSTNNAWVFASLSYDGRVVINHVPAATKYEILL